MKISVSLDKESGMLLEALQNETGSKASRIVQEAIKVYAETKGYILIPAKVARREDVHLEHAAGS